MAFTSNYIYEANIVGNKYLLLELICLQCRKNSHVDQERVDEADGSRHVVDEEHVDAMKRHDHHHVTDHEGNGNRNQAQTNLHKDGDYDNMNGGDLNKIDHHVDGGLPLISDSVFSLIIMVGINHLYPQKH